MRKAFILLISLAAMMTAGLSAKAQDVTITLLPGCTWISYPNAEAMDVATALGDFVPTEGDIIKSQYSQAVYSNGQWIGRLRQFTPGLGYMYYSSRAEAVELVFTQPTSTSVATATPSGITTTSAVVGGTVTLPESGHVFLRGVCWGTEPSPDIDGDHTTDGTSIGSFSDTLVDLIPNTSYYVRAYAVTDYGLVYGNEVSFTTIPIWTIEATPNPIDGGTITGTGSYEQNVICNLTATPNEGFVFANWSENGEVVSTEASLSFTVTEDRTLVANFTIPCPTGAIDAKFSINNNGDMVYFSQGNLQYRASTNTWRFADNQYDYVGSTNSNISSTYSGWIDLFAWGTSGYNHGAVCYQPWSISENNSDYFAYGYSSYNLNEQNGQADWGYNAISNGGNQTNQWRTLTKAEWVFLLNTRNTPSGIRFAMAKVNNVNGVIILPDNWSNTYYALNNTNNTSASFSSNSISLSSWSTLEANGAVFLPAAGFRDGTYVYGVGSYGGYQTATYYNSNGVYDLYFSNSYLLLEGTCPRSNAQSVRLVRSIPTYTINVSTIPSEGGTVTGTGNYAEGQLCTLTAIASSGYTFVNWMENGEEVSTESSYSFTVMSNKNLVANFGISCPAGAIDGKFTINSDGNEVYFSKGNLQYIGSANTSFWKFADNQWDCFGTITGQNSSEENLDRDLFGWGTSGYDHGAICYQPWSMSTTYDYYYAYGNKEYNLFDQTGQADWGYNPISNGGNQPNRWRTLTKQEWDYVFDTRTSPSGIRYAKAEVNEVNGMILLPDDWDASYFFLTNTNNSEADFSSNTITASQWSVLEQHGAVFLPAAGIRDGTSIRYVNSNGYYWSASYRSKKYSHNMYFNNSSLGTGYNWRYCGFSVRLVCPSYFIEATSNILGGGVVMGLGSGSYHHGSTVTLTASANEGYIFNNWTENGEIVATDATYSFVATGNRNLVANFNLPCPTGAIDGVFTVSSDGNQMYFSKGNLQYIGSASTPYWKFAENQWDYLGSTTNQNSSSQTVDRDLFGWATSGYNHGATYYQPWSTSTSFSGYDAYGSYTYNLYDQTGQADWGYNPISNGGNQPNQWRTLTMEEWDFVFNTRSTFSGIRYAKAQVNGVNGIILLPDGWSASYYTLSNTNSSSASFNSNTITATQWNSLEQKGVVFLPAAGYRHGVSVYDYDVGNYGHYWSASCSNIDNACNVGFSDSSLSSPSNSNRKLGFSIRLVCSAQ